MLKRSGSKRIIVDGQPYRYVLSEVEIAADGHVRVAMTAQHADANGGRLRVTGICAQRVPVAESKFHKGRTLESPVRPRDVERMIRMAVSRGWDPLMKGGPFVLDADEDVGVPNDADL